jgi:hypothetical protein
LEENAVIHGRQPPNNLLANAQFMDALRDHISHHNQCHADLDLEFAEAEQTKKP